jgi:hypothetical protein
VPVTVKPAGPCSTSCGSGVASIATTFYAPAQYGGGGLRP